MTRIQNLPKDTNLQPGDKWVGTDVTGNVSRNYTLESVTDYIVDIATGDIIINEPDEEDITAINKKLKFKDRDATGNQQGYKIIRADFDWLNIPASYADSIWEIRYDFSLGNAAITLPDNVCLKFNGGFISNYTSITAINGKSTLSESEGFDESGTVTGVTFGEFFTTEDKTKLDVTIGATGADYTTYKEAADAGETKLEAINDTTEIADTTISNTILLHVRPGVTCDFGPFNVQTSVNDIKFIKEGDGDIRYASTTNFKEFFDQGANINEFIFQGGTFINNSILKSRITNATKQIFQEFSLQLPDLDDCGIRINSHDSVVDGLNLIGGGPNCHMGIRGVRGFITNLTVTGIFKVAAEVYAVEIGDFTIANNIYFDTDSLINGLRYYSPNITLSDVSCSTSNKINIDIDFNDSSLENVHLRDGVILNAKDDCYFTNIRDVEIQLFTSNNNSFKDIYFSSSQLSLTSSNSTYMTCNQQSDGDLTFNGDDNKIEGITLSNGDIIITGDNNKILPCSANNIIINVGATNNTIIGDTPVTDNGTGTKIVLFDDDTRLPTQDENDALVGTNGTPSTANKYVTDSDPRISGVSGLDGDSGEEAAVSFTGNPKTATVTFGTPLASASYTALITTRDGDNYNATPENRTVNGFDINLNANPLPTNSVLWAVILH